MQSTLCALTPFDHNESIVRSVSGPLKGNSNLAEILTHKVDALLGILALSTQTGIEGTATWEWGFLKRESSGLYCLDLQFEALGRPFLQTAERLIWALPR